MAIFGFIMVIIIALFLIGIGLSVIRMYLAFSEFRFCFDTIISILLIIIGGMLLYLAWQHVPFTISFKSN